MAPAPLIWSGPATSQSSPGSEHRNVLEAHGGQTLRPVLLAEFALGIVQEVLETIAVWGVIPA